MSDDVADRISEALDQIVAKIDKLSTKTNENAAMAAEALGKAKTSDRLLGLVIAIMLLLLAAVLGK